MSGNAISTMTADDMSYTAITTTAAGVRMPARNTEGRYAVKYGRRPSRPRVITVAAESRSAASCLGGSAVMRCSTWPARSAITAVAPRAESLPCAQCASVRTAHSDSKIHNGPVQCAKVRDAGSVMMPATMCASTTDDAIVAPVMSTPHATDATRYRRIAPDARHRFMATAATARSAPESGRR